MRRPWLDRVSPHRDHAHFLVEDSFTRSRRQRCGYLFVVLFNLTRFSGYRRLLWCHNSHLYDLAFLTLDKPSITWRLNRLDSRQVSWLVTIIWTEVGFMRVLLLMEDLLAQIVLHGSASTLYFAFGTHAKLSVETGIIFVQLGQVGKFLTTLCSSCLAAVRLGTL